MPASREVGDPLETLPATEPVITSLSPVAPMLDHPTLVVRREIEWLNIFAGFEQANRYAVYSPEGQVRGKHMLRGGLLLL